MKKNFFVILILLFVSCSESREKEKLEKPQEKVDLNKLKKAKQKEIDSLKILLKQLQQKKDSLKKIISK